MRTRFANYAQIHNIRHERCDVAAASSILPNRTLYTRKKETPVALTTTGTENDGMIVSENGRQVDEEDESRMHESSVASVVW